MKNRVLQESGVGVVAAHLDRLVTLVRLMSAVHQRPSLYELLMLRLLALIVTLRHATTIGMRRDDDVVVVELAFGEELTTICIVPRAP